MTILLLALTMAQAAGHTIKTWMSNPTMVADGTTVTYLTVYQTTDDEEELYRDFEIHITVPEGLSLAQRKEGRKMVDDIALNADRFEGLPQVLAVSVKGTAITAVCANMTNKETFYRDDADGNIVEELFTIGLVADPGMVNGKYDIEITVAKFALPTGGGATLTSPAKSVMTITGGQSALSDTHNLSVSGFGTLILPFASALPDGVKAYTSVGNDTENIYLYEAASLEAYTPYILYSENACHETLSGTVDESLCPASGFVNAGNLNGAITSQVVSTGYVLQNGVEGVKFYAIPNAIVVPAGKCWVTLPSDAKSLNFVFQDANGLDRIVPTRNVDGEVYTLDGRKAGNIMPGRIYIKNGEKFISK